MGEVTVYLIAYRSLADGEIRVTSATSTEGRDRSINIIKKFGGKIVGMRTATVSIDLTREDIYENGTNYFGSEFN